ncbi:TLC domain-containing protein 4-B isoform X2 [Jatropha curcas]|uniref:TLC domain-containing protein 4-B isoform X2 n=1 Tax=Jatropha curcas TaxID=180498 RepID=UPI0005FB35BF|nr:TLC domain-containing protein 4-B isoform X2 [Jatropha curcas]
MVGLHFPSGLPSIGETVGPTRLASILSGIIMCIFVYKLTAFLSLLCFKSYSKLNKAEKIEWNNRGFSTFHAVIVAAAAFYLVLLSNLFDEDSQDESIVNRASNISNFVLGISVGYFLSDLAMILWYFPALGGLEYVVHHGLSMYSIFLSLVSGQGQIYILMVLFSESTTPFVNLRWHLDVAGQKSSNLYVCNGVLLFLGWLQGFFCSSTSSLTCLSTLIR